ncbi:MAG: PIN domain-containing protein [Chitinivibrionales bacterium]|nr:PIN domain-containing protein [Chitinivibrionales bacterium]
MMKLKKSIRCSTDRAMKIILDTHIFLWCLGVPEKIPKDKQFELETLSNIVYVSSVSIAELMIKSSIGKLKVDYNPVEKARESGFELLDFAAEDALVLKGLPFHHKDPFDRMLIAQSLNKNIPICTDDGKFRLYDCKLI